MKNNIFSLARLWAVMLKEFIQMRRDRPTLVLMLGIPLMQVILFGFAINSDPKHLPTAVVLSDNSEFVRTFVQGMQNSGYFQVTKRLTSERVANNLLASGDVLFVLNFPTDFTRRLLRGEQPNVLLEADATDPSATSNAVAALRILSEDIFQYDFAGVLSYLQPPKPPINLIVHPRYNPAVITQYNIVTGLLGVVLTLTMTMTTAVAITRERDRGTMESLLATPIRPLEVMLGKILPYVLIGYLQISIILLIGKFIFGVPMLGNLFLLYLLALPFIAANLSVGITVSTIAKNPLQATQMAVFYFLPSLLLSGFMFPFRGMPIWAQWTGEFLPLTHFLRIARGILLKGNHFFQIWPQMIAILIFLTLVMFIGVRRFRRTLD